jgi:hypothetical protein
MTAKLTDRERWRRELARWIVSSGASEAEYLPRILAVTEDLIQLYRRKPQQDWLPGLTLEHLCFHRWIMMAALKGKLK